MKKLLTSSGTVGILTGILISQGTVSTLGAMQCFYAAMLSYLFGVLTGKEHNWK